MDTQYNTSGSPKDTGLVIKRQIQMEAISKAIYLVTDLLEKDEPIRSTLRKVSVELLDSDYKTESLRKLHSLLRLAKDIQIVSDMNASLLISAIEKSQASLEEKKDAKIEHILKAETVAGDSETLYVAQVEQKEEIITVPSGSSAVYRQIADHQSNKVEVLKKPSLATVPVLDIGSRRKRILEVVRSKGQATINEFIESIQGCSSKTIQRELTSLVLSGTLKKTGERRWSKYSLK